jgi:sec-independent protein translocase protein TatB
LFDIGFSELMVIGVVALVVIGPERLPKVARTAGHLFGRMQRYVSEVKADINREVDASELRDLKNTVHQAATSMQDAMTSHVNDIGQEIKKTEEEFNRLSNPMLHFGLAGASGAASQSGVADAESSSESAQQQLELGLGGDTETRHQSNSGQPAGT